MDIKLLSFDIDDTLLPSHQASDGFYNMWNQLSFKNKPLLCYNTGRLKDDTLRLINLKILPKPDFIICGVGTLIYDFSQANTLKEFAQILEEGWDIKKVSDTLLSSGFEIKLQPERFQNAYKASWYLKNANEQQLNQLKKLLRKNGLDVNVIYSSNLHLDILPKWANKGNSLVWLLRFLNIEPEETLVAGNSGNDSAMYEIEGINGVLVGNAQPELVEETKELNIFYSNKLYEEAILEGLQHFGIDFSITEHNLVERKLDLSQINFMETVEITGINKKQLLSVQEGYEKALEVLKKNITPIGFSACSLEDNEIGVRDMNYRSVWARDGCIVISGTTALIEDKDIYHCQRRTLETLLVNVNENGQVPTYVSIDTRKPDYSGKEGICSIDSGLWLIIAFHDFIKASGDIDFLRENIEVLSNIMQWLAAHDSNNDSLLEIPEAGDWMYVKGRSYNILHDEVLWYQANVCMGRMYELLSEDNKTGKHITWSQVIKNSILINFWPATTSQNTMLAKFDGQNIPPNEARYLVTQTSPFGFGWRCDIYANILAHLYGVIDKTRASSTFRFIWGSGGNEPFPVKNIYPAILTEDPDQRSYDDGSLLNLPNHYHNGGVWPFIGGAWVRYISKLGLKEVAQKELFKLSKLNKLGIFNKWEFNEWYHGSTGRPMGKAYQAWSASEYIHACHELGLRG